MFKKVQRNSLHHENVRMTIRWFIQYLVILASFDWRGIEVVDVMDTDDFNLVG